MIDDIFIKMNISKKYIGLISKYIVDIGRCFCLINKGFKVFKKRNHIRGAFSRRTGTGLESFEQGQRFHENGNRKTHPSAFCSRADTGKRYLPGIRCAY